MTVPLRSPLTSEEGNALSIPVQPDSATQLRELKARPEASEEEDILDRGHLVSKAQKTPWGPTASCPSRNHTLSTRQHKKLYSGCWGWWSKDKLQEPPLSAVSQARFR